MEYLYQLFKYLHMILNLLVFNETKTVKKRSVYLSLIKKRKLKA